MNVTDIVALSDKKEYLVAAKVDHKDKTYVCFVDMSNYQNVRYGYLDKDEVVFLKKETVDSVVLLKLFSQMTKLLSKMS